jgi:hypothetical protein
MLPETALAMLESMRRTEALLERLVVALEALAHPQHTIRVEEVRAPR